MLYYWKFGKQKLAYDTASGAIIPLTSLEYKMIQAINPPLTPLCPSSLRYELAKFDASDVEDAYARIYTLFQQGLLFSENHDPKIYLRIGGPFGLSAADELAHQVASLLEGRIPEFIVQDNVAPHIIEEIGAVLS